MRNISITIIVMALYLHSFGQSDIVGIREMSYLDLLQSPFGHDEGIESFTNSLPKGTKIVKLIRRSPKDQAAIPDTIITFKYKKSNVGVYKTRSNQVFTIGASIRNKEVKLANGVCIGIRKEDFFSAFTDLPVNQSDTLTLSSSQFNKTLTFYFNKKGKMVKYSYKGTGDK